jgi:hypothetical protein
MPLFEVTLSDGSTSIMQAHNKTQLRLALQNVLLTKAAQKRCCKQCRKAVATVQNTLCQPCWDKVLIHCHDVWKDVSMTEQELKDTAMSYFVDG